MRRASESPIAAARALTITSGPVGLAETNSSRTRCPAWSSPRPYAGPPRKISRRALAHHAGARKTLMKPGPATSSRAHLGPRREVLDDGLGDLARRPLGGASQHHRGVGRVVAVLALARHFPDALRDRRQLCGGQRRLHSFGQSFCQALHKHKTPRGGGGRRHDTASVRTFTRNSRRTRGFARVIHVPSRSASSRRAAVASSAHAAPPDSSCSRRSGAQTQQRPPSSPTLAILPCVTPESM